MNLSRWPLPLFALFAMALTHSIAAAESKQVRAPGAEPKLLAESFKFTEGPIADATDQEF